MKKTKILLPLLSVGAIATTAGAITSCGCHGTHFTLTETVDLWDIKFLKFENVNLKKETTYTIECDLTKISDGDENFGPTSLSVYYTLPTKDVSDPDNYDICKAEVSVDGKKLQLVNDFSELVKNTYAVLDQSGGDNRRSVLIAPDTLNKKSKLKIKIQLSTNVNDGCLFFGFAD